MVDRFEEDFREAQGRIERLRQNLDEIANTDPSKSVARFKYIAQATWKTLQQDVQHFNKLCHEYDNEPLKQAQLSKKEKTRRVSLIEDLKSLIEGQLTQEYNSVINQRNMTDLNAQAAANEKYSRGEDGEFDQTRDLSNKEVLLEQKRMLKDQDGQIEEVIGVVKATKYEAQDFGKEITKQNVQLEKLNQEMETAEDNMLDTDSKMQNFLAKSNHCWLWVVIVVELAILILLWVL